MCLETNYLNFGGAAKPELFNFADRESSALQIPASHFPTPGQDKERKFSTSKLTAGQNQSTNF
jgi:hypothetical protein